MWLHVLSWYVGVAIWFSLGVPLRDVSPVMRVLGGLVWPVAIVALLSKGKK